MSYALQLSPLPYYLCYTLLSPVLFVVSTLVLIEMPEKNSNKHNSTLHVSIKPEKRVDVTVKYFSRSFCWIF